MRVLPDDFEAPKSAIHETHRVSVSPGSQVELLRDQLLGPWDILLRRLIGRDRSRIQSNPQHVECRKVKKTQPNLKRLQSSCFAGISTRGANRISAD